MAETIADEWRKARKPHRCIWCGELIAVGETYRHWRGKFEVEVMSWHKECDNAAPREDLDEGFEPYFFKRGSQEERTYALPKTVAPTSAGEKP